MSQVNEAFDLEDDPLWYKNAIIYEVHVRAFYDSNKDGIGDFCGLIEKLEYLQDLGITTIWLLPFYPSPLKDDGYDISDYMGIHPAYGTLRDFTRFLNEAHRRNLRVITELVINHTSDQHPWFQRARRAEPGSKWRNFYVWSDTPEKYKEARIIFKDFESSNWAWDPIAKAYYWHRFYSHQPDLNFDNPEVLHEIFKVVDFWLRLGVDGLRLDAVPYLYEEEDTDCENLPKTHQFLKSLRQHIAQKFKNRMLLAEANQWPEDAIAYFGNGDECHMAFHFPLMPRLFMAISTEDHFPVMEVLQNTPPIPEDCQWALFLRNHDELTLEMVTDEQRDYMYRVYARDARARINLGIRHRLAPLLGNHRRRIELINSLLFSLPGTPVLYYGDEINMGDNIYLGDRNGVRTPMQWNADRNAGFSQANPQRLYLPIIIDPAYHYEASNVEVQQNNPYSFLWWMKRLIATRKRFRAFGQGSLEFLHSENPKVLAFVRRYQDECVLIVANLSRFVQSVELDLTAFKGMVPVEIFGQSTLPPIHQAPYFLTLGPHSFYWLFLGSEQVESPVMSREETQIPVITLAGSWENILKGMSKPILERNLPAFLEAQSWFGGTMRAIRSVEIVESIPIPHSTAEDYLALVHVDYTEREGETIVLPLTFASGGWARRVREEFPQAVIASLRIKDGTEEGVLCDATWDNHLMRALLDIIVRRRRHKGAFGEMEAFATSSARTLNAGETWPPEPASTKTERGRTTIVYKDHLALKLFRRVHVGMDPDLEMRRFLTEKTSFHYVPPIVGYIDYKSKRGDPATLAILEEFVPFGEDAWQHTLDTLGHYMEGIIARRSELAEPVLPRNGLRALVGENAPILATELIGPYLEFVRRLGQRTAELHRALASDPYDPAFAPEPFTPYFQRSLYESMRIQANQVVELVRKRLNSFSIERDDAKTLLALAGALNKRFHALLDFKISGMRIRCNGDYHLGHIRYTGKDFIITDFEGDPTRPISERQIKRSPLTDVACMLVSFENASIVSLKGGGIRPEDIPFLEPWTRFWRTWVSATFLDAYLEGIGQRGFFPEAKGEFGILLDVYLLNRAVTELLDALNGRPGWIWIALRSLLHLLAESEQAG